MEVVFPLISDPSEQWWLRGVVTGKTRQRAQVAAAFSGQSPNMDLSEGCYSTSHTLGQVYF